MIPSVAYTTPLTVDGSGGPPEHFPTAFTEHFPVVHAAKYGSLGLSVSRGDQSDRTTCSWMPMRMLCVDLQDRQEV